MNSSLYTEVPVSDTRYSDKDMSVGHFILM